MYVTVQHTVTDREGFMAAGPDLTGNPPAGIRPLQFFPSEDGAAAVCLWEGPSVPAVAEYIESKIGAVSDNRYFGVAAEYAIGLPATQSA